MSGFRSRGSAIPWSMCNWSTHRLCSRTAISNRPPRPSGQSTSANASMRYGSSNSLYRCSSVSLSFLLNTVGTWNWRMPSCRRIAFLCRSFLHSTCISMLDTNIQKPSSGRQAVSPRASRDPRRLKTAERPSEARTVIRLPAAVAFQSAV